MIPDVTLDRIRERVDFVQVARDAGLQHIRQAGKNYTACCPFHEDGTPSFSINPSKGVFRCFGCGETGNVFQFVERVHGVSFPDAVCHLAAAAGVQLQEDGPTQRAVAVGRERSTRLPPRTSAAAPTESNGPSPSDLEIRNRVYRFIIDGLAKRNGEPQAGASAVAPLGRKYLSERGLDLDASAYYGFRSLDNVHHWERLRDVLLDAAAGISREDLAIAGLWGVVSGQPDASFLMPWGGAPALLIPFWQDEKIVGIRFRRLNYKGRHKYNSLRGVTLPVPFNAPALAGINGTTLNLVEGELNAWTLHLAGLHAVGIPGVQSWRDEWAKLIRPARRILIWFDGDDAGRKALHGYERPDGQRVAGLKDRLSAALGAKWVNNICYEVKMPASMDANAMHVAGTLEDFITQTAREHPIR